MSKDFHKHVQKATTNYTLKCYHLAIEELATAITIAVQMAKWRAKNTQNPSRENQKGETL